MENCVSCTDDFLCPAARGDSRYGRGATITHETPGGKSSEDMSARELSQIMKYLGGIYRRAKKRADLCGSQGGGRMDQYDRQLIYLIDRTLQDCSRQNSMILRRTYFENSDEGWYAEFLSASAFYRLKKEAAVEFLNCLDY